MARFFAPLFALVLGLALPAGAALAGPANYEECYLLHAKKASTPSGRDLMRRVCKCRFQEPGPDCAGYSVEAMDCVIQHVMQVEKDRDVSGVDRACRNRFPATPR